MRIEENLLIDRFLSINPDTEIVCESTIPSADAPIFSRHFPGNPIMPGIILTELMAQSGGYLHMLSNNFSKMPYLATIRSAVFRRFVVPGDRIHTTTRFVHQSAGYVVTKNKMRLIKEGRSIAVADSELMLKLESFENSDMQNLFIKSAKDAQYELCT